MTKLYLGYSCDTYPPWMEEHLGRNARYIGKSVLRGYQLCFRRQPGDDKSKASIVEKENSLTPCVLWQINSVGEKVLEKMFAGYEKKLVSVEYCGINNIEALAFIIPEQNPLSDPDQEIVETIKKAYKLQDIRCDLFVNG